MTAQWRQLLDHLQSVPERAYEGWNAGDGWDNDTTFGRQFGENLVSWCVIFDWCMYADVGLGSIVPKVDNVSVFTDWARARGQWSDYPSVGAWVNFGSGSHTEIVVGWDADTVYTKGGNSVKAGSTDAGQGNGVWPHATPRRSARVVGYFAPRFPDGQCPPTADPADPRGGRAQTSYTWPGPDAPAPTPTPAPPPAPTPVQEDDVTPEQIEQIAQRSAQLVWDHELPHLRDDWSADGRGVSAYWYVAGKDVSDREVARQFASLQSSVAAQGAAITALATQLGQQHPNVDTAQVVAAVQAAIAAATVHVDVAVTGTPTTPKAS